MYNIVQKLPSAATVAREAVQQYIVLPRGKNVTKDEKYCWRAEIYLLLFYVHSHFEGFTTQNTLTI